LVSYHNTRRHNTEDFDLILILSSPLSISLQVIASIQVLNVSSLSYAMCVPCTQILGGALSLAVKLPGREVYLHALNTPSWRGSQLKHGDNFTFTFTLLL